MDLALRLYLWNIELAGAFHSSLGLLEVILRNTIDAELRAWNASQSGESHRVVSIPAGFSSS